MSLIIENQSQGNNNYFSFLSKIGGHGFSSLNSLGFLAKQLALLLEHKIFSQMKCMVGAFTQICRTFLEKKKMGTQFDL